MAEWEARITILKDGEEFTFNDALGDTPTEALYTAHNDLELELERYERKEKEA